MLHYSCDLCKRPIDLDTDIRHVVRIEVFPAVDDPSSQGVTAAAESRDVDPLEDMHELLDRLDEQDLSTFLDDAARSMRFDLCEACRQRFLRNPLGAKPAKQLKFSNN
jgi:hypothetical protein